MQKQRGTYVNEQAKHNPPHDADEQVGRPVDEAAREGEQPDNGEDDGQARDDFCVDEATQIPR